MTLCVIYAAARPRRRTIRVSPVYRLNARFIYRLVGGRGIDEGRVRAGSGCTAAGGDGVGALDRKERFEMQVIIIIYYNYYHYYYCMSRTTADGGRVVSGLYGVMNRTPSSGVYRTITTVAAVQATRVRPVPPLSVFGGTTIVIRFSARIPIVSYRCCYTVPMSIVCI